MQSVKNFADRLIEAITNKRAPVCVGLDPLIYKIPHDLRAAASNRDSNRVDAVL